MVYIFSLYQHSKDDWNWIKPPCKHTWVGGGGRGLHNAVNSAMAQLFLKIVILLFALFFFSFPLKL